MPTHSPLARALGLGAALAAAPAPAAAQPTLFDTFGPGLSYSAFNYGVNGAGDSQAFRFVPSASAPLGQITVALGRTGAAQTATVFTLFEGASSTSLGRQLEVFTVPNVAPPALTPPFTGVTVTFTSVAQPLLTAGQGYWLAYSEPEAANGASSLWFFSPLGVTAPRIHFNGAVDPRAVLPAFRVEAAVAVVPEPATFGLVAVGVAVAGGVAAQSGRRRRAHR